VQAPFHVLLRSLSSSHCDALDSDNIVQDVLNANPCSQIRTVKIFGAFGKEEGLVASSTLWLTFEPIVSICKVTRAEL